MPRRLLVLDNDRTDIHVIDTATDAEIDRVPLLPHVWSNPKRSRLAKLMFSRDGRHLVVTGYAGGLAWIIDAADYRAQSVVPVAKGPMGIAFPEGGTPPSYRATTAASSPSSTSPRNARLAAHDGGGGIEVMAFY